MKPGISYWMLQGGLEGTLPVTKAMEQAKELGYDSIELCIGSEGAFTHQVTQQECEKIVAKSRDIGIEISSLASGESWGCSPTANDPAVRQKNIEFTRQALQVAAWLGTDTYLYVPGAVDVFFLPEAEVIPYDVCYDRARQAVGELLETAEKCKVTLGIENVWNRFLLSPLEMRDFIDSFHSAWVGSYFDIGNVWLSGYPDQWIRILGRRIKRVHIKDFKRSAGTVEGFVDLLEGDVDFSAVRKSLAEIGYDGYITAEVLPYEAGRPEKTCKALKKILS